MQPLPRVEMLSISAPVLGRTDTVHPTLILDGENAVLVDTGFPGQFQQLVVEIGKTGVSVDQLSKVIMTHQDLDHTGNLPGIVQAAQGRVQVLAHELEKPFIQGEKRLLKATPEAIAQIDRLPPEVPAAFRSGLKALLENPPIANFDKTITDGEELADCGGIVVIATPGHTPGHVSLYHKPTKTLIAGDALMVREGRLLPTGPQVTFDMDAALQSIRKLAEYDIETVVCYHGGLYRHNVNQRISELVKM